MQDTEPYDLPQLEAGGKPLRSRVAIVRFRQAGHSWERIGDGEHRQCEPLLA